MDRWTALVAALVASACIAAPGCKHDARLQRDMSDGPLPPARGDGTGLTFPLDGPSPTPLTAVVAFEALSFDRPVFLTYAPDGRERFFVVEQAGRIRVFNDADAATAEVFLDITDRVRTVHNEEGLLGLAFHPDFANNGQLYVFYSASNPRRSQISRFTVGADGNADPTSESVVIAVDQPYGNHNGGTVLFGPDGALYASFGDGGAADDPLATGQDLATALGTIVRINVRPELPGYQVPSDNPFVDQPEARPEIWAYGLRNPWRFSFDRHSGELWAADVGQDAFEEVDQIVAGGNYGWSVREGTHDFLPGRAVPGIELLPPIVEYGRELGESITGGYVYRGTRLPGLRGAYFYGDYVSGRVWALTYAGDRMVSNTEVARVPSLASFGEDASGELYAIGLGGTIFRFVPASPADERPAFPTRLSETGIFADLSALQVTPGLVPYEVNVEFWSDAATKRRWLAVPKGETIAFDRDGPWAFPVGTVVVKHFELPGSPAPLRLETRVMVHERQGWAGYTYRWNDAQTDAELVGSPVTATVSVDREAGTHSQAWEFPAGSDCLRCHTSTYGPILGLRTRQLNRVVDGTNQLDLWNSMGLFASDIGAASDYLAHPRIGEDEGDLGERARAYLDVNCAVCHHRGGPAPGGIDMRVEVELTDANLVAVPPEKPLGIAGELRIAAGDHARSSVWARLRRRDADGMPPLASGQIDGAGSALIAAWIDALVAAD